MCVCAVGRQERKVTFNNNDLFLEIVPQGNNSASLTSQAIVFWGKKEKRTIFGPGARAYEDPFLWLKIRSLCSSGVRALHL